MHKLVASFHRILISGLSMISLGSLTSLVYSQNASPGVIPDVPSRMRVYSSVVGIYPIC